jgi:hypothetical protein
VTSKPGKAATARTSTPSARTPRKVAASREQALTDYREAFVAELDRLVVPAVIERLRAGATALAPQELAQRMLAVSPAPAPKNKMAEQVGPTYFDTAGVMVVLAEPGAAPVSKQAVEHRRKRGTVLALQTSDKRWIYPTWQFRHNDVMPGLPSVLGVFRRHPTWSVATWLTTPSGDLDGKTAVEWLEDGQEPERVMRLARHTAARWAA